MGRKKIWLKEYYAGRHIKYRKPKQIKKLKIILGIGIFFLPITIFLFNIRYVNDKIKKWIEK